MPLPLPANHAEERIEKLLEYWSEIELSIKRAELISHKVPIPAINELRYAGRQLLWAVIHSRKSSDPEPDRLEKAIVVAEQYLINADHDVVDAVVLFFGQRIDELSYKFGRAAITSNYPSFAKLCELNNACYALIEQSRRDSTNRRPNYKQIKTEYLPNLIDLYSALVEADVIMTTEARTTELKIHSLRVAVRAYRTVCATLSIGLAVCLVYLIVRVFY